jgi:DivIVA domain-containing protein
MPEERAVLGLSANWSSARTSVRDRRSARAAVPGRLAGGRGLLVFADVPGAVRSAGRLCRARSGVKLGGYLVTAFKAGDGTLRRGGRATGLDDEEADAFLDWLVGILRGSDLPDYGEVRNVEFTTTRWRPGYAMKDVDRFLREIAEAIRT